ncbi:lactate racemase domain-containing protein [Streptomyces vinaceus]|uniref:lactate racemase domain-containing protein n=1 Tax=Streptomyces vinaceus TaxID=1960 RepID=UPI0035D57ECA
MTLPFGAGCQQVFVPAGTRVIGPSDSLGRCTEGHSALQAEASVHAALDRGLPGLAGRMATARRIALCVTDGTRPTPVEQLLTPLLARLTAMVAADVRIDCVMATGLHESIGLERLERTVALAGAADRVQVTAHNAWATDLRQVGTAGAGVPVWINPLVAAADVVICVGVITAHPEAGYSGGAKCVVPGVAGATTIKALHEHAQKPLELRGELRANPFRSFLEEAAALLGDVHVLNAVLHPCGDVAQAVLGPAVAAHREAAAGFEWRYGTRRPESPDVLVIAAGGAPADSSLYLAEGKAWRVGLDLVGPDTRVVLVGECSDGVGGADFEAALMHGDGSEHSSRKAWFLRELVGRARHTYLVHRGLPSEIVRAIGVTAGAATVQEALAHCSIRPADRLVVVPNPNFVVWTG